MPKRLQRKAFTLAELVISLGVTTLLMAGMGSAMLLASRAVPNDNEPLKANLQSYHVLEKIAMELTAAKTILSKTATNITFTVEDRNADLVDETFKYSWTGTPGGPLSRNGGGTVIWETIASNVYNFTIVYDIRTDSSGISRLYTVNFHLQIGSIPESQIELGVALLNTPQVTP